MTEKAIRQLFFYVVWAFYSCAYFLLVASSVKLLINVKSIMAPVQMATLAGLGILLIHPNYSIKYIILVVGGLGLSMMIMNREVMILILFAVNAKQINFKEFLKFDILMKSVWVIMIIGLFFAGVLPNVDGYFYGSYKQSWGFQHPNTFAMNTYMILMEYLCLKFKKLKLTDAMVFAVGFLIINAITRSRTAGYSFLAILLVVLVIKIYPKIMEFSLIRLAILAFVPFLNVLSLVLTVMYGYRSSFILKLNKLLSGRIFLQFMYWNRFDVKLFGQNFDSGFADRYFLDNGYMRALLEFGLVFLLVLCAAYIITFYRCMRYKRYELVCLLLFCTLLGFTESTFLKVSVNVSILLFFNDSVTNRLMSRVYELLKGLDRPVRKKLMRVMNR